MKGSLPHFRPAQSIENKQDYDLFANNLIEQP
jgi:hypothetical protein